MITFSEDLARILRRLWSFFYELPPAISYEKRGDHNISIIRAIGTILPLAPAPRVVFNLAAWNPELERFTDDSGCEVVSPKVIPRNSSNYQIQINELHDELKAIKEKLAQLLEKETSVKLERLAASQNELIIENEKCKVTIHAPPPPPPPPMPDLTLVTSKPPHIKRTKRTGPRSPGGRPIKQKKEPELDTNDILAKVLKKRYSAIQESSDAESFNASFTNISSPI